VTETAVNAEADGDRDGEGDGGVAGRRVLLLVGGLVVVDAALVGLFVGANGAENGARVIVFGVFELPAAPAAVALYAGALAFALLAALFVAVETASRAEGT